MSIDRAILRYKRYWIGIEHEPPLISTRQVTLKSYYCTHESARGFLRLHQGQAAWEVTEEW